MAEVYRVRHRQLGTEHVLKLLTLPGVQASERLLLEGQVQAQLKHPNVVEVRDVLNVHGAPGLLMELIDGPSLDRVLTQGRLTLDQVDQLVPGICAGVAAAHARGFVHRDLKPANVLLQLGRGRLVAKVADFGLVKLAERDESAAHTADGATLGTPLYMAPEQVHGARDVDHRADIWALGALLYELATGHRAFSGDSHYAIFEAVIARRFVPPQQRESALPQRMIDAIHACLAPLETRATSVEAVYALWSGGRSLDEAASAPVAWPDAAVEALRALLPAASDGETVSEPTSTGLFASGSGSSSPASTSLASAVAAQPPQEPPPSRHHLPSERDAFIGRQGDLRALASRLDAGARLLTVLGIGGTGKTRLVTRFGWEQRASFPGGAWFCDLSDARDVNGIAAAVARAFDVPLGAADPVVQLGHAIAARGRCLMLLDNFEQVTEHAAATVGRWLDRAAEAVFVVTSRELLSLPGEDVIALDPLPDNDATALFIARATQAKQGFIADDLASIDALMRLLDGLPLAIELAAARVRLMSPAKLLERMSERFKLLASPAGRPSRHATMRGVLDWSWALLSADEQQALAQLSVFEGGFTLEAAEAVLALDDLWPVDAVQALVDKSLVRPGRDERFDMLISVQAYASEQLDALSGRAQAESRHGLYFAAFGDDAAIDALDLDGTDATRPAFNAECTNLIAACRRATTTGHGAVAVATARAAWQVLSLVGPLSTGVALAAGAEAMPGLGPTDRARIAGVYGWALRLTSTGSKALAPLERALSLARDVGDRNLEALALGELGVLHKAQGHIAEARSLYAQAMQAARDAGDLRYESAWLGNLGLLSLDHGELSEAEAQLGQALAGLRSVRNVRLTALALGNLGTLRTLQGRLDEARAFLEQARATAHALRDLKAETMWLGSLGSLDLQRGDVAAAEANFTAAIQASREMGYRWPEAVWTANLGRLHLLNGQHREAHVRLSEALDLVREFGHQRLQGFVHGELGSVLLAMGDTEQARLQLDASEEILRAITAPVDLAIALCHRARLEYTLGQVDAYRARLAEAEALTAATGVGAMTDLGMALAAARAVGGTAGA